ncbi:MAG: hypothetical protein F9K44_00770 [Hyphomicrobiaceae bacterium]|nr:MAG: hypothetical protein F9K44_00770 [Hyphomicrobiaceae bacterium]
MADPRTSTDSIYNFVIIGLLVIVFITSWLRDKRKWFGKTGKPLGEMVEESLEQMKRKNDLLQKILEDQSRRIELLEGRKGGGKE